MAQNREQEQKVSQEYKRVLSYYNTFITEAGKNVLKDLMHTFYDVPCFVPGDSHGTSFNEGQRSVVLYILSALRQSQHPEIFERNLDDFVQED